MIKWLFGLFFMLGVILGVLVASSIEESANVAPPAPLSATELKQVKQFIHKLNPQQLRAGKEHTQIMSQDELNLMLSYLAQKAPAQFNNRLYTRLVLDASLANIQASIRLPSNPMGQYLNVAMELAQENATGLQLQVKSISLGNIVLPGFIAQPLMQSIHQQAQQQLLEYRLLTESLRHIGFNDQQLTLSYVWDAQTLSSLKNQIGARVIADDLKQALIAQTEVLSRLSQQTSKRLQLNTLLQQMFRRAQQRSHNTNAVTENQAIFITLGAYALNRDVLRLLSVEHVHQITPRHIFLKNRYDLSKHFMISAAITSVADPQLAESIGLEKEVRDTEYGSGFSFADLAADLADIQLAHSALASEEQARLIQDFFSDTTREADYMPDIRNLPEGLHKVEFNKAYVNTQSDAYNEVERIITQRIDALPLFIMIQKTSRKI